MHPRFDLKSHPDWQTALPFIEPRTPFKRGSSLNQREISLLRVILTGSCRTGEYQWAATDDPVYFCGLIARGTINDSTSPLVGPSLVGVKSISPHPSFSRLPSSKIRFDELGHYSCAFLRWAEKGGLLEIDKTESILEYLTRFGIATQPPYHERMKKKCPRYVRSARYKDFFDSLLLRFVLDPNEDSITEYPLP